MFSEKIIRELSLSKDKLIKSKMYPKRLTGACNVSSISVFIILEKNGLNPTLVNNHKHAFNIIKKNNIEYVVDLTASQLGYKRFPNYIECRTIEEMDYLAKSAVKGKLFYTTKERKKCFFAKGSIEEVLTVKEEMTNDAKSLFNILSKVVKIENLNISLNREITKESIDQMAKEVIQELRMVL